MDLSLDVQPDHDGAILNAIAQLGKTIFLGLRHGAADVLKLFI